MGPSAMTGAGEAERGRTQGKEATTTLTQIRTRPGRMSRTRTEEEEEDGRAG